MDTSLILMLIVVSIPSVLLGWVLIRAKVRRADLFRQELENKGIVIQELTAEDGSLDPFTRMWGYFEHPLPLFLLVSNQHTGARLANVLGFAGSKLDDPGFDNEFYVRTNNKELTKILLTQEIRSKFRSSPPTTFLIGSIESLLDPTFWPEDKTARRWRNLWLFESMGHIKETEELESLKELSEMLKESASRNCLVPSFGIKSNNKEYIATTLFNGDPVKKYLYPFCFCMLLLLPAFFILIALEI